jgi:hypothetical protein
MFEETICIDLGASYTKIARRLAITPNRNGTFSQESKIVSIDRVQLIPSLAIRTRDMENPWIFGQDAAEMNPGADMQVFQNWKADLFRPANDKVSGTAIVIAHRFFVWLKSKLEAQGVDFKKCQTRIAMPAFDTFDERAELVARCMDLSGWDDPALILKVREPRANVIGMFAENLNFVRQGDEVGLGPDYGRMFGLENIYIRAARDFHLYGTRGNTVKIMVVDIGAFTTDIALLSFDVTDPHEGLKMRRQISWQLGVIDQLDKPMFATLGERHGFSPQELKLPFKDYEELKKLIHRREKSESMNIWVGGKKLQLDFGNAEDFEIAETAAKHFAVQIWGNVSALATAENPERIFLTGGGSLIATVSSEITRLAGQSGLRVQSVNQRRDNYGVETLERFATALGGCNVILQASADLSQQAETTVQQRPPLALNPIPGFHDCRCHGKNIDCCFCHGRGCI